MSFADLTLSEHKPSCTSARRLRIFAPNAFELGQFASSIDEIELDGSAGMIFEDEEGIVVGWMWPGERLNDIEFSRLKAVRAHVVDLSKRNQSLAA